MEINEEKLTESLRSKAREIGLTPWFWERMAQAILKGEIPEIDPGSQLRTIESTKFIALKIHEELMPGQRSELTPELLELYKRIIKIVVKGYGLGLG